MVIEGFTGKQESFFQIHGHSDGCWAYPPLMLMFDGGKLVVRSLRGVTQTGNEVGSKGSHKTYKIGGVGPASFNNTLRAVSISYDATTSPGQVSVSIDGKEVLKPVPIEIATCGKPHIKFGIYRPGKGANVSSAAFDDMTVTPLN